MGWLLAMLLFALPWKSFTVSPQLERIRWNPAPESIGSLYSPNRLDDVLNFLFYVPLGFAGRRYGKRFGTVVVAAAALSIGTEAIQMFSSDRDPSILDVITNVSGAAVGAYLYTVRRHLGLPRWDSGS